MKIGIMQPYFFPYLGYFSLIKYTDQFILLDVVQFIRHGWIERNRILKSGQEGWNYIRISLIRHEREATIKDILIREDENWRELIFRQLEHYKKKAPFYEKTIDFLQGCFKVTFVSIAELDAFLLEQVCQYLGISKKITLFSKMNLNIEEVKEPDDWALNICIALHATEYINPAGGMEIFDKNKYSKKNVTIKFLKNKLIPYNQFRIKFESGLSIIDALMFNSPESVNQMLDEIQLLDSD